MLNGERITAMVPAKDEAAIIGDVVKPLLELKKRGIIDHVLVVDDGSTDGTWKVARELGADVIGYGENKGKGHALAEGADHAKGVGADILFLVDADMKDIEPMDVKRFLERIAGKKDIKMARAPYFQLYDDGTGSDVCPAKLSGLRAIRCEVLEPLLRDNPKWRRMVKGEKYSLEQGLELLIHPRGRRVGSLEDAEASTAKMAKALAEEGKRGSAFVLERSVFRRDEDGWGVYKKDGGKMAGRLSVDEGMKRAHLEMNQIHICDFDAIPTQKGIVLFGDSTVEVNDPSSFFSSRERGAGPFSQKKIEDGINHAVAMNVGRQVTAGHIADYRSAPSGRKLTTLLRRASTYVDSDELESISGHLCEMLPPEGIEPVKARAEKIIERSKRKALR